MKGGNSGERVVIRWLGHSCFRIVFWSDGQEIAVITDPFRKGMGYTDVSVQADVVTISHGHSDHDQVAGVLGDPLILRGLTEDGHWASVDETVGPVRFTVVGAYHDPDQGARRGRNACFVMKGAGLTLVHLGDLGHIPDPDTVNQLSNADVLLVPVGGYFTIGPAEALQVVSLLRPKISMPMHYKTPAIRDWPIKTADEYLAGSGVVRHMGEAVLKVGLLPDEPEVWVLEY